MFAPQIRQSEAVKRSNYHKPHNDNIECSSDISKPKYMYNSCQPKTLTCIYAYMYIVYANMAH